MNSSFTFQNPLNFHIYKSILLHNNHNRMSLCHVVFQTIRSDEPWFAEKSWKSSFLFSYSFLTSFASCSVITTGRQENDVVGSWWCAVIISVIILLATSTVKFQEFSENMWMMIQKVCAELLTALIIVLHHSIWYDGLLQIHHSSQRGERKCKIRNIFFISVNLRFYYNTHC